MSSLTLPGQTERPGSSLCFELPYFLQPLPGQTELVAPCGWSPPSMSSGRHRVCQNALDDIGGNNLVAECSHATDFTSSNYFMAASCELPGMQMLLQSLHACFFFEATPALWLSA